MQPLRLAAVAALPLVWALFAATPATAARTEATPMARVQALLQALLQHIHEDGDKEQVSYDEYACWCEDTLQNKAKAIADEKDHISSATTQIKEYTSTVAALNEEMQTIRADIKANAEAQASGQDVRDKEAADYAAKKNSLEQSIGALEAAIRVLTGAGERRTGFLGTLQEAKVLSVAASIRKVLVHAQEDGTTSEENLMLVRKFADRPEDFLGGRAGGISAAQIANNPFGDYAPESTQIQGILKKMYEQMVRELEKANAGESRKIRSFQELAATKRAEMTVLQHSLDREALAKADTNKDLADANQMRDDEAAQLKADKELFESVKLGCREKALQWSERSRLRTEEMMGVQEAITVLGEGHETFLNATSSFVQVSSKQTSRQLLDAAERLRALAKEHHSLHLLRLAGQADGMDSFDAILASIDRMVALLRAEEQADIAHRDRCQRATSKNNNDMEDLNSEVDKTTRQISKLEQEKKAAVADLNTVLADVNRTQEEMAEAAKLRAEESAQNAQILKDDLEAERHLREAKDFLLRFYKRNNIHLGSLVLTQREKKKALQAVTEAQTPTTYAERTNTSDAPETIFQNENYGGRKHESKGIIYILEMLAEDMHMEAKRVEEEEAKAARDFARSQARAQNALDAQLGTKMATEGHLAGLEAKLFDSSEQKRQSEGDVQSEKKLQQSIYTDCSWVKSSFDSRSNKRKEELKGLQEARGYLAGVASGDELAP